MPVDAQLNKWIKWSTISDWTTTITDMTENLQLCNDHCSSESNISPSFVPFNPDGTIVRDVQNQLYANSPLGAGDGGCKLGILKEGMTQMQNTLLCL